MLSRLSYLFDRSMRNYIARTLIFPIIIMYDFIYASASSAILHRLDVAYNDLMRIVELVYEGQHMYALKNYTGSLPSIICLIAEKISAKAMIYGHCA